MANSPRATPVGPGDDTATAEHMKSLRTGLRVLLEFERAPRDLSVTELSNRCGLSKSQVSKILSALVDSGLVVQDSAKRTYHVGQRCYLLGSRFTTYDALCQAATPVMRDLLNRTEHSIWLSIPYNDQSLYVIGLEGPYFVDTGWHSGRSVPMSTSSAGRVMMAFMPAAERDALLHLPVPALTSDTVTDPARLEEIVHAARETGYSVQRNETSIGLGGISVPIFKDDQQIVGALGAAFPAHFVSVQDEPPLIRALHDAARAISQRLGCAVYPIRTQLHAPAPTPTAS